jgi:hypothetical protein
MPGFMPGIHVFLLEGKTWMAGTSPAMTGFIALSGGLLGWSRIGQNAGAC